jgi:hypothetical protein
MPAVADGHRFQSIVPPYWRDTCQPDWSTNDTISLHAEVVPDRKGVRVLVKRGELEGGEVLKVVDFDEDS